MNFDGSNFYAARGMRPPEELAADRPHGIRLRYRAGCRCLKCRMANSNYETMRSRARKAGDWNGIVDAEPARLHLRKLSRAGVGYKTAADAASVARTIALGILSGRRPRARARTVRRLCAVTNACRADAAMVSARRTWRFIGLLLEEGFTRAELARRMGYRSPALQFRKHRVLVRTAAKVERLYRRLTT